MSRYHVVVILLLFGLTNEALSFDDKRQGFILGIGLGPGVTTYTPIFSGSTTEDSESRFALTTDFKIGHAPSDYLQIYWNSKVSWFELERQDVLIVNGFGGAGFTYLFQQQSPSPFISGGLGISAWSAPSRASARVGTGFGFFLGVGHEFATIWNVEGDLIWGDPGPATGLRGSTLTFKVTFNLLAY